MLADGTLSRATFLHELVTAPEATRVRELDDAVALGLGARARGERLAWLQAPGGTDERVIEIPWALSRLVLSGRVRRGRLRVRRARLSRRAPPCRASSSSASTSPSATSRAWSGSRRTSARFRCPTTASTRYCLVSTLEHVGADNTGYGLDAEDDPGSRADALRELRRVLVPKGSLLVTVPLGEPGDHGWFRLDDVDGWTTLFTSAGFFVEEQEAYELTGEGWRSAPSFDPQGVGYGDRGPAASAVLCTELSPGRLRRLATPGRPRPHREASDSRASTSRLSCPSARGGPVYTAAVDFSLTDEQREIQALAREVADTEIAPHACRLGPGAPLPPRALREARRARPDGRLRARGARRSGRRLHLVRPRARGALARRRGRGGDRRGAHERRDPPDRRVRHRRAAGAVRAAARARGGDRRVRAHRAGLGLGCQLAADDGGRRRGRLAHQRDEAVVHEREPRLDLPPLRADGLRKRRAPAASPRSSSAPSTSR